MKDTYEDIIHLPRPTSKHHAPMPMENRAAQFAPFSALTGYEDSIHEAGRYTEGMPELSDSEQERLERTLQQALEHPETPITLTYFIPDATKAGGSYRTVQSAVKRWNEFERTLTLEDGTTLPLESILEILPATSST